MASGESCLFTLCPSESCPLLRSSPRSAGIGCNVSSIPGGLTGMVPIEVFERCDKVESPSQCLPPPTWCGVGGELLGEHLTMAAHICCTQIRRGKLSDCSQQEQSQHLNSGLWITEPGSELWYSVPRDKSLLSLCFTRSPKLQGFT